MQNLRHCKKRPQRKVPKNTPKLRGYFRDDHFSISTVLYSLQSLLTLSVKSQFSFPDSILVSCAIVFSLSCFESSCLNLLVLNLSWLSIWLLLRWFCEDHLKKKPSQKFVRTWWSSSNNREEERGLTTFLTFLSSKLTAVSRVFSFKYNALLLLLLPSSLCFYSQMTMLSKISQNTFQRESDQSFFSRLTDKGTFLQKSDKRCLLCDSLWF